MDTDDEVPPWPFDDVETTTVAGVTSAPEGPTPTPDDGLGDRLPGATDDEDNEEDDDEGEDDERG